MIVTITILLALVLSSGRTAYEDVFAPFLESYPWATEEPSEPRPTVESPQAVKRYNEKLEPWIVGLRGMTSAYIWYTRAECMGLMVKPNIVMTLCACVMSWYSSFVKRNATLKPYPKRLPNYDILADEIYVYSLEDNKVEPVYVPLIKPALLNAECQLILSNKSDAPSQTEGLGFFETRYEIADGFSYCHVDAPYVQARVYSFGFSAMGKWKNKDISSKYLLVSNVAQDLTHKLLYHVARKQDNGSLCVLPGMKADDVHCYEVRWENLCGGIPGSPICRKEEDILCCFGLLNVFETEPCQHRLVQRHVVRIGGLPEYLDSLDYFSISKDNRLQVFEEDNTFFNYEDELTPPEVLKIKETRVSLKSSGPLEIFKASMLIITAFLNRI